MSTHALENTPLDEAVCLALYSAMNATVQLYRDLLAPWGLTYQQLLVLGLLWHEEEATPGQISEALRLDSSTVAGLLKRLETAGLLQREADSSDRRRVKVRATEQSQQIAAELGWLESCVTEALNISAPEARDLIKQLHSLRDSVDNFARPSAPSISPIRKEAGHEPAAH